MFTVTRTGSTPRDVALAIRQQVQVGVPLAVAKALTFTVQKAQKAVVAEMPRVFEGGATPYTRNSTRIVPAKPDKLAALLAVKDRAVNSGTRPEDYLFPQVFGGPRKEKRFERSLRYAGVLKRDTYAILGRNAPRDSYGNLKRGELQRILTATRTAFDPYQRKTTSARSRRNAKNAPYFVGGLDDVRIVGGEVSVRKGRMQPGIYRREGGDRIVPVLIFVNKRPTYKPRLDFEAITRETALREFEPTLARLLQPKARA